jgi:hypothetical protein
VFWTTQASISRLAASYTSRHSCHNIPSVIITCFVLHNVAKYLKDNLPTNDQEVEDLFQLNDDLDDEDVEENQRKDLRRRGQQRRREIGR